MSRSAQAAQFEFAKTSPLIGVDRQRRVHRFYLTLCLLAAAIFVFAGILMLPLVGLQSDEVMFVYQLWHPREAMYSFPVFHHFFVPSMLMSYLGALKSWVYAPVLGIAPLSVWSIRFPVLVLAAITILLTGRLLRKIQGRTAAVICVGLLATDVTFLVTSVFDWGPVVIQNLLLVAGIFLAVKWYRERRDVVLFLAGIVFGLALWNKALFVWNLSGLAIALLVVALPELIRAWRWKAAAVFVLGLCIGAFQLIAFNLQQNGLTLQQNSHVTLADVGSKAAYLRSALNGQQATFALVDITRKGLDYVPRAFEQLSLEAANDLPPGPSLWRFETGLALIVAGLLAADRLSRKWILFFLISGLIAWFESAITVGAGGSIHHTVLFWINWYCAVALAAAAVPRLRPRVLKPVLGVLIAFLCLRGLFLMNLEYAHLISYDASTPWANADKNLAAHLTQSGVTRAIVADWGIANVLDLRSKDKISTLDESFVLKSGNFDRDAFAGCEAPACVVVSHVPQRMMFPQVGQTLDDSLRASELVKADEESISDTHGFPVYSVFHVRDEAQKHATQTMDLKGPPALIADPAVIVSPGGLGETTLSWRAPATTYVEVHIGSPNGRLFASSKGPGSSRTGLWVNNDMQFFLQDRSGNKPLTAENTLAKVRIEIRPR